MIGSLLFDVAPDPVSSVGAGVLIILAIIGLVIAAVLIGGFVFLLVWRQRRNANAALGSAAVIPTKSL